MPRPATVGGTVRPARRAPRHPPPTQPAGPQPAGTHSAGAHAAGAHATGAHATGAHATGATRMNDMANRGELTYRRVHDAPRELPFACMTTPEHLTHFWGPAGTTTPIDG